MIDQRFIRNFAIIAHVDHGKSTLSDRFLEITHTIEKDKLGEQFLDMNVISKKRGITIKLAPVRMKYHTEIPNSNFQTLNKSQLQNSNNQNGLEIRNSDLGFTDAEYVLNLIDTPGHVDFSYEVSRTLAACEGAVLLVDATQGIQAQTVAHFHEARKQNLVMIPVINKIDLPNAQTAAVVKELISVFGFTEEEIIFISAKTGENVPLLLEKIVTTLPSPRGDSEKPLRALIFDAVYDEYRGVIAYIKVIDGSLKKDDQIQMFQNNAKTTVTEVGFFNPFLQASDTLGAGEIGYVITGIKDIRQCRVGDTIISEKFKVKSEKFAEDDKGVIVEALTGYTIPKPMIFFGMFPKEASDFAKLRESLGKLTLNDTALTYTEDYSAYLGSGFRVGFLGLLHAEIVKERLQQEFNLDLLLTMPQVLYEKEPDGQMREPYMLLTIYVPVAYVGNVMTVCQKRKGNMIDLAYHDTYATLTYELPYTMFIRGLSAELKSVTSGYASIDYEVADYRVADLVSVDVKINDNVIDVLSELIYREDAIALGREKAAKLKDSLDRQQFRQIIQAVVNGTIIAREEIPPYRKDVLAKMSGGDRTRKDKLLEAQKKGKKRMISTGKVNLPQEALFNLIENN